jgi:site-specific DNA-cytosine methylase
MLPTPPPRPPQGPTHSLPLIACELYAGVAGMSAALARFGWTIAMLCESQPHLRLLLEHQFPAANVQPDVDAQPWLLWSTLGMTALLIVAGISCQPFSDAGPKLAQHDPRALDALKVLDAAVALQSLFVLLENVPNYVREDGSHGVFSRVRSAFTAAGFTLQSVSFVRHNECGGRTSRERVFILFVHSSVSASRLGRTPPPTLTPTPATPAISLQGHTRCNWLTRGCVTPFPGTRSSKGLLPVAVLQLGCCEHSLSPGSVVLLHDEPPVRWRVTHVQGHTLSLRSTDRRDTLAQRKIHCSVALSHLACPDSRYTVYDPAGALPMIRASGDPPGYGGPLIQVAPADVRSLSTLDRAALSEFDPSNLEYLDSIGCSEERQWSAIGNSIPTSMVRSSLLHITAMAAQAVPAAHCQAPAPDTRRRGPPTASSKHAPAPTATPVPKAKAPPRCQQEHVHEAAGAQPQPLATHHDFAALRLAIIDLSTPPAEGYSRVLLIPVSMQEGKALAWLPDPAQSTAPAVDVPSRLCGTGSVTRHAKRLLGPWALADSLALAGSCCPDLGSQPTRMFVTSVCIRSPTTLTGVLQPCTLAQLAGSPLELPTGLVMAGAYSHSSSPITLKDVELLATASPACVGAAPPKRIRASRIAPETTSQAARDCLTRMQQTELGLASELELAAQRALEAQQPDLVTYLREWSQQITTASLQGVPPELLENVPTFVDPRLASLPFSRSSDLPDTEPFAPIPDQTPVPGFEPRSEADLLEPAARATLDAADAALGSYFSLLTDPNVTQETLMHARPDPVFVGQGGFLPQAKGKVWDMRGPKPKLLDFNAPIQTHLNRKYFAEQVADLPWVQRDAQLLQQIDSGVRSQTDLPLQFRHQPPLLSLATGHKQVGADLLRLRGLGYLEQHKRRPFLPFHTNPQGAVAKKGTLKRRRTSDMGAPRKRRQDSDGNPVQPFNVNAKYFPDGSFKQPKEVKLMPTDIMMDGSILRHVADLLGMPLVAWTDDLRDFFNQLKLHPSLLWMICFQWPLLDDDSGSLGTIVEHVLGYGLVFASNVAQRFANAVTHIFLKEFDRLDAPFLEAERAQHPVLDAWLSHRETLPCHAPERGHNQARLLTGAFYMDDLFSLGVGAARAVRAKVAWFTVTRTLNLLTAEPRKRLTGSRIPFCGLEYLPSLGLVVVPESKTLAAAQVLLDCESGRCEVGTAYRPLMGLLQFIRWALKLPKSTVAWMLEPLRQGQELDSGPATWVRATPRRCQQWAQWRHRLLAVQGVGFNAVLPETPEVPLCTRALVWHGDASLKGTDFPAMCGFNHGLYWILPLEARWLQAELTIAAWEFLTQLGNYVMFGPALMNGRVREKSELLLLLQCDSLVSTHILTNDAAKEPVLVFIHQQLLQRCEFKALEFVTVMGHEHGERNVASDHGSRGREGSLIELCAALGTKASRVTVSPHFLALVEAIIAFSAQLKQPPPNEHTTADATREP